MGYLGFLEKGNLMTITKSNFAFGDGGTNFGDFPRVWDPEDLAVEAFSFHLNRFRGEGFFWDIGTKRGWLAPSGSLAPCTGLFYEPMQGAREPEGTPL